MATKSKKPLISVITCTYNSEKYLEENVQSVQAQTFTNFEHIFIDGYSKDNTLSILKKYKGNNNNVQIYKQKPMGISAAMNEGINKASGRYILHLHSDDKLADKNSLKNAAQLLSTGKYDMVIGKIVEINEDGKSFGSFPPRWVFNTPNIFLNFLNFIPHQGVFLSKEVFEKEGLFDTKYKYCMDYDMWLRIYKKIRTISLEYPISKYRVHSKANSANKEHAKQISIEYRKVQYTYSPRMLHLPIFMFDLIVQIYLSSKRTYLKWIHS